MRAGIAAECAVPAILHEDVGQQEHDLCEVFNVLCSIVKTIAPWRWMPNDLPPG